jgi:hypothetical protein
LVKNEPTIFASSTLIENNDSELIQPIILIVLISMLFVGLVSILVPKNKVIPSTPLKKLLNRFIMVLSSLFLRMLNPEFVSNQVPLILTI